ncbi:LysR family transcriptional regulator [Cystobacter ferrugineus]|uniref:LysR family transcriptional regulator n=1 Tax=Cystobacter ferrugineus TaxID=83449 RepID=A0A1L9AZC9_9BACT|nr:LysR family transcriptional regulator [Cystobacter ferrugineus]OJH35377.1 LysR family transcriptional regulator [Cystobacter ferrugineus]
MLHHLPAFFAVAEHKNFTRAAASLGISTSAVSQSIRALEAHVGAPLLARTTRSVSMTEAGRRLLETAAPAVKQAREALDNAARQPGELSGVLRLNVPLLAVKTVMGPVLPVFHARHPGVRTEVWVENRFVDIVAERFDAGIRLMEGVQRDMVTTRLMEPLRFVVVGSPAYLGRKGRPTHPRQLAGHQIIGWHSPTNGTLVPWDLERRGRVWKVPASAPVSTNDTTAMLELAVRGLGLAYIAETLAAKLIREKKLEEVLSDWAPEVPGVFLYFPSRAQASAPLRAFIECAREVLATPTRGT